MTFLELAKARYSVRAYKDQPIEEEKLSQILEAGCVAPSAHNNRPVKIYVAKSDEAKRRLEGVCPCTFGAPVILVVGFDQTRQRQSAMNPGYGFGEVDASIACTHMMLAAADLGLGACWVGMFNKQQVADILGLPQEITVTALLPVGYPAEDAKPAPMHTQYREDMVTVI